MTTVTRASIFPASLIAARKRADAAWDAERDAWSPMSSNASAGFAEIEAWSKVRRAAFAAQAEFEAELANWRKLNGLG